MEATEQEIKEARLAGANRERQIQQAREFGAELMRRIINERKAIEIRLKELHKEESELLRRPDFVDEIGVEVQKLKR